VALLMIKGLLFDLDGVLVDSGPAVEHHWRKFAARNHLDPDPILSMAHGRRSIEVIETFIPSSAVADETAWFEDLEEHDVDGVTRLPGVSELLDQLPQQCWAVVTSCGTRLANARMFAAGVPLPSRLISADDVTLGKPDPEGYRAGLKLLGVQAHSALVFEDAPAGIKAAHDAGIKVVAVATTFEASQLHAEVVVGDLRSISVENISAAGITLRVHDAR
jgi:sugar-phosphatase